MQITELLDKYNVVYRQAGEHHHCTTGYIQFDCPFCSPKSGRYRMGYNLTKGFVTCWSCGHHPLTLTLQELINESYPVAKQYRKELSTGFIFDEPIRAGGKLKMPPGVTSLLPQHKKYLSDRGFNPDKIVKFWGVQGIGLATRLQWRLWIPVHLHGRIVSWTTRSIIANARERYINAKPEEQEVPIKSVLYGADFARHAVIVCEGPFDVWKIGPGAVCTFGIVPTQEQIAKISKYPKRAICFDNEGEAHRRAKWLCEQLACLPGETYRVVLRSKDPGSASREEISRLRREYLDD